MTARMPKSKRPTSRGPRCANLVNGQCAFSGGRCIDGARNVTQSAEPFFCNFFKSLAKTTAARVRWAKKKRGDKSAKIGRRRKRAEATVTY